MSCVMLNLFQHPPVNKVPEQVAEWTLNMFRVTGNMLESSVNH